jgi:hypothetical protein
MCGLPISADRAQRSTKKGKSKMPIDPEIHGRLTTAPPEEELQIYGPWNPGVESTLPSEFLPLSTVFSSANVSSSVDDIQELNGFCGLAVERLSTFRPARLALHEVLIRVMADLSVPDGEKYEDLGVNFRKKTATILDKYIAPKISEINRLFDQLKREASDFIDKAQTAAPSLNDGVKATRDSGARHWSQVAKGLKSKQPHALPQTRTLLTLPVGARKRNRSQIRSNELVFKHCLQPPTQSSRDAAA